MRRSLTSAIDELLRGNLDAAFLGLEHMLAELDANPTRAVPLTLSLAVQSDARVRIVPIADPAPCWPWCIVWRRDDRNPALLLLLDELAELSRINGWAEIDPQRHWLHDTDLVDLRPQRQTPCGTWEPSAFT